MAFRIKSNYTFKANRLENGNWSNEFPELVLSKCDDRFLSDRIQTIKTPISIQPERMKFCNIFNVTEQSITYSWYINEEEHSKTYSINKGRYNSVELQDLLNKFDDRINFKFEAKDKNGVLGKLTLENLSENIDIIITMNRNLLFLTGLVDIYSLLGLNQTHDTIPCIKKSSMTSQFDMSRSIREIKLYSKYVFDYKTELCCKVFSSNELNCLNVKDQFYDNQIQSSNIQGKIQKVDRFDVQSNKFYFLDFFDELVYFDYQHHPVF